MEMEESVGPVNLQKRRIKKLVQESKKLYLCAVAELDSNIRRPSCDKDLVSSKCHAFLFPMEQI
jgi:hypothetical protein